MTAAPVDLAAVEKACDQATPGPWELKVYDAGIRGAQPYALVLASFNVGQFRAVLERHNGGTVGDARLAALSRTAMPAMAAALRDVVRLHRPYAPGLSQCQQCNETMPCETLQAIAKHVQVTQ